MPFLSEAKNRRRISIEDLRDAFAVSYETAAHRFTNLATARTRHPGALHEGARVGHHHQGVRERRRALPDAMRWARSRGSTVLPQLDRAHRLRRRRPLQPVLPVHRHAGAARSGARPASRRPRRATTRSASACRSRTSSGSAGGRPPYRAVSRCPDDVVLPSRARRPGRTLGRASPGRAPARPTSLLAALPTGTFPGVDATEVYEFLEAHAPRGLTWVARTAPSVIPCRSMYLADLGIRTRDRRRSESACASARTWWLRRPPRWLRHPRRGRVVRLRDPAARLRALGR